MSNQLTEAFLEYIERESANTRSVQLSAFEAGWDARTKIAQDTAMKIMHEMNNERPDYIRYGNIVAILSGNEPAPWVKES